MDKPVVIWKPAYPTNYTKGRANSISRITFHHIVGDAGGAIARFQTPNEQVSASYVIGSDGTIYQTVADDNTPWTDANPDSNSRAITIEHAGGNQSVPYTQAMYSASEQLVAWLIQEYGIEDFKRHRDVSTQPTQCSGALDVERIVSTAKQIIEEHKSMIRQEAVAILDAAFGRLAGRKIKDSELDEYIPYLLEGEPDKFFKKFAQFDEVKKFVGDTEPAPHVLPAGRYEVK